MSLPYPLSWEEFKTFVLPHLERCGVMETDIPPEILGDLVHDLYEAVTKLKPGWQQISYLSDKYSILNWDMQRLAYTADSTSNAVALLHHYKKQGIKSVIWTAVRDACQMCTKHAKITHQIDLLLDAYRGISPMTVLPCPDCQHLHADGGGLCRCVWVIENEMRLSL